MRDQEYKSPLHKMVVTTDTDLWNDSCAASELQYAIDNGAVGATANPVIVGDVLRKELERWEPTIKQLIADNPTATEDDIAWRLTEAMSVKAAALLLPAIASSLSTAAAQSAHEGADRAGPGVEHDPAAVRTARVMIRPNVAAA